MELHWAWRRLLKGHASVCSSWGTAAFASILCTRRASLSPMKLPKSDAAKQRAARLCFVMGGCSVWAHSLAPALPWCPVPVCWDSQPSYLSAFCGLNLTKQLVYKLLGCAESLSCSVGLLASVRANRLCAFHRSVLTVSLEHEQPQSVSMASVVWQLCVAAHQWLLYHIFFCTAQAAGCCPWKESGSQLANCFQKLVQA